MNKAAKLGMAGLGSVAMALGGAAWAYASWTVPSVPFKAQITTATMPAFHSGPTVQPKKRTVTVRWIGQKIDKGIPVQRYIVTRRNAAGTTVQVCGEWLTATTCKDGGIPDGTWTYSVRTVQGSWIGPASPPSAAVIIGGSTTPPPSAAEVVTAPASPQVPQETEEPDLLPPSPVPTETTVRPSPSAPTATEESEPPAPAPPPALDEPDPTDSPG